MRNQSVIEPKTDIESSIISLLNNNGSIFQSQLADKIGIDSRKMSDFVLKMERDGTIGREKVLQNGHWINKISLLKQPQIEETITIKSKPEPLTEKTQIIAFLKVRKVALQSDISRLTGIDGYIVAKIVEELINEGIAEQKKVQQGGFLLNQVSLISKTMKSKDEKIEPLEQEIKLNFPINKKEAVICKFCSKCKKLVHVGDIEVEVPIELAKKYSEKATKFWHEGCYTDYVATLSK